MLGTLSTPLPEKKVNFSEGGIRIDQPPPSPSVFTYLSTPQLRPNGSPFPSASTLNLDNSEVRMEIKDATVLSDRVVVGTGSRSTRSKTKSEEVHVINQSFRLMSWTGLPIFVSQLDLSLEIWLPCTQEISQ
jgi:hypothetical protein